MTRKEGRKEIFYLTTHSTHFIYGYMASARDKMVDSKYINYNTNTYTNTHISIYYVILQIFNTDIRISKYL